MTDEEVIDVLQSMQSHSRMRMTRLERNVLDTDAEQLTRETKRYRALEHAIEVIAAEML